MNRLFISLATAATLILLLEKCKTADTIGYIKPPLSNINVHFTDYTIEADKDDTIRLANGTSIFIPANSLVNANDQPITGNVSVSYREFHSLADIIASGIPMEMDSAGTKIKFQSAGMFDIKATQHNSPVYIAKNKSIQVNMASFKSGDNYNFYYLDTVQQNWQTKGYASATVNTTKKQKMDLLGPAPAKPITPEKYDGKSPVFNLDINLSALPELSAFSDVVWKPTSVASEQNQKIENWVFNYNWANAILESYDAEKAFYRLTLSSFNKNYSTIVTPAITGKSYEKAMALFKDRLKEYETIKAQRSQEEVRLAAEGDFIRSFAINNFGIYNWDRQYKEDYVVRLKANFRFDQEYPTNDISVFLVVKNQNMVIKYPPQNWDLFSINPDAENVLIAILPGNKMAQITSEEFKKLNISKKMQGQSYTFKLLPAPESIKSFAQLQESLDRS